MFQLMASHLWSAWYYLTEMELWENDANLTAHEMMNVETEPPVHSTAASMTLDIVGLGYCYFSCFLFPLLLSLLLLTLSCTNDH